MKGIADISVGRPVTTGMVLVSVLVLGVIAFTRLPLAFFPDLDFPAVFVTVPYPNSSPQQIEEQIVKPIEEALATLPGVTKMSSQADADQGSIQIFFDWGESVDIARMKTAEKIDEVRSELPDDIEQIFINTFSTTQIPVVEARISAPGIDLSGNYDLLEKRVLNPISRVPGVAKVELNGVEPSEVRINLRLYKIAEHGVDLGDLAARLMGANRNVSLGKLDSEGQVIHVRSFGAFNNLGDIEQFPVNDRGLVLRDVADITYREPPISIGRHLNGRYAVALSVFKEATANTVDTARRVTALIENEIAADPTLEGINLFVFNDQAAEITSGLQGLLTEGLLGGALAMVVLFLFLRRFDTTFIVGLAIPMSIIATAVGLFVLDKSLNVLVMMGLMLGIGLLVDDAIVVLESIFREHTNAAFRSEPAERRASGAQRGALQEFSEDSADASRAAIIGARKVWGAVFASTVTTAIVFLPMIVGQRNQLTVFLEEIGWAITLCIFSSLVVSMTLIPLMASRLLSRKDAGPPLWTVWLSEQYVRILRWTFRHRFSTFGITVAIFASTALPFALGLQTAMFAGVNQRQMRLGYEFTDFHYKEEAELAVNEVEAWFFEHQDELQIESVYSHYAENDAATTLTFKAAHVSEDKAKEVRERIRNEVPKIAGARLTFDDEDAETGGDSTFFRVNLFGEHIDRLALLASDVEQRLAAIEGIEDAKSSVGSLRQEIQVSLNQELAANYGVSPESLAQTFAFTLGGRRLRRYNTGDKEVELILMMSQQDVSTLDDLKSFVVSGEDGRGVTLGTLAEFKVVDKPKTIERENRKTLVSIRSSYEGEDWDGARKQIEESLNGMAFPVGYSWSFGERIQEQDRQLEQMIVNYLLALALIYIVMASQFESLVHPFAILFSIPFAFWGVTWFLLATNTPLNFMAQIGLLVLMGIVVKNGIVLIDHINNLRREGYDRETAIELGGKERLRPILMTASTAVLALVPMAIGRTGLAGLYYFPLARTVIGGLMASTFLTLVILPFIYVLFDNLAVWWGKVWREALREDVAPSHPQTKGDEPAHKLW
ncbi:MAG: efflux RND transporter permease subunit [Acidobacteria bacterium]|nr:MAG: efflux RND transporter permease subunit [Acidobacteriota bacterium]